MTTKYEILIDELMNYDFGSIAGFISDELADALQKKLAERYRNGYFFEAGIGNNSNYLKDNSIRGDQIFWLDRTYNDPVENEYLDKLDEFMAYLNNTCYTGLNDYECHYALYEPGTFYKKHLDRFKSDLGRIYSVVTYLNDNWTKEDGGEIVIYGNKEPVKLLPEKGRMVFFKSDKVEHEVLLTNRPRLSIAGWLKKTNIIP